MPVIDLNRRLRSRRWILRGDHSRHKGGMMQHEEREAALRYMERDYHKMKWELECEITHLRAEVERLKEQLRYEKMNTDVWQRDAEGKLEDRTEAYQRISELTAALKVAKDAMAFKTKPLCMCFAGCGECQPDPMPPTLEEAIATIDEALK